MIIVMQSIDRTSTLQFIS